MQFEPPLQSAKLLKRYKRFLADVVLPTHEEITIHCPNTGAMTGCAIPGSHVWMSKSDNAKRKYAHTWELAQLPSSDWVCVNTHRANKLIEEALSTSTPPGMPTIASIQREVKYGEKSRCDLVLEHTNQVRTFVEIKSVTLLADDGCGFFPDAVSARASRQLQEFMPLLAEEKTEVAVIYAILHSGIKRVEPAGHIDPYYAEQMAAAKAQGLKVYQAFFHINQQGIKFSTWGS